LVICIYLFIGCLKPLLCLRLIQTATTPLQKLWRILGVWLTVLCESGNYLLVAVGCEVIVEGKAFGVIEHRLKTAIFEVFSFRKRKARAIQLERGIHVPAVECGTLLAIVIEIILFE
jgi:hypothetical protein